MMDENRTKAELMSQSSKAVKFQKVTDANFVQGEHEVLRFWTRQNIFGKLQQQNAGKPRWSFLDGPITANNPMGVHHAWGRTYKDTYQRYFAMTGHELRYQNGFDCQGLWVEVEVEKQLGLGTKSAINDYGIDKFVNVCKQRVLKFAARQTEQSVRLGYWMEWDHPEELRKLSAAVGSENEVSYTNARGEVIKDVPHRIVSKLGNPEWGGSYFTFATENNETIWTFIKKCFNRGKVYMGHDVMPWSGRGGSAYSQMEVADGRKLTVHQSIFVRFPLKDRDKEYLLVWTTTPWTMTSNVAAAVNVDLEYVKVRAKRDGSIYYFAKDNLEFKRLDKEFKEGFGRPEWAWPKEISKLKTIATLFKEQGGYDIEGTIKGAEMVGWKYAGPFDDLPAQNALGGLPQDENLMDKTGVSCHQVIDGGRDFKGSPNVTAGEGTGIVHIAPGCGDIDHQIGMQLGLVAIAPLGEDGKFQEGFGELTGKEAINPETVQQVFALLKDRGFLFAVEHYPHIYPHCWRTGDELVFRLVDEWFINMDWREEIMDVTRAIRWLPDSIDGQQREVEWLSNMRDWMISKKRFWGLALPIWVDRETGDFEVMGSLAELKSRAVEGWDEFEGHTPHRPWIDKVKIQNPKNGNIMTRVEDVGNPWLDAGIVPFSTMGYNTHHEMWKKWFPADLVTECFPGQFRNWFYSLLSMATMMGEDQATPEAKRPFKTLLGHRLVMNEEGKPMHKSDGSAIWFEEAAEQLGVDTLRWLYLMQNPATDLRFGTRHKDKHVTLDTVDGPITETLEGLATCLVTSKPADEIRRQFLIPLWNSYAFFVNYARLDEFDPTAKAVPYADRPEIDRWILSCLQALIKKARTEFEDYNVASFVSSAGAFIDDLSNWYIRRNRRRFWRSRDAGDSDKLAAYQTMYEVLVTLSQMLAPVIPFLAERIYQNLVFGRDVPVEAADQAINQSPASVHLCAYPEVNPKLLDEALNARTALAQRIVALGHKVREKSNMRVRQPLAEIKVACSEAANQSVVRELADVILDELNIKKLTVEVNLDGIVKYQFKPNMKTIGPKYGKLLNPIREALTTTPANVLNPLIHGATVSLMIAGENVELSPADVMISTEQSNEWASADEGGVQIAISTELTEALIMEGVSRDLIRQIQQARKDLNLDIQDRIRVVVSSHDPLIAKSISAWKDFVQQETLCAELSYANSPGTGSSVFVGESEIDLQVIKV
jgi:isoleucyl-tRNA synthetase